jgi:hypothetical protein
MTQAPAAAFASCMATWLHTEDRSTGRHTQACNGTPVVLAVAASPAPWGPAFLHRSPRLRRSRPQSHTPSAPPRLHALCAPGSALPRTHTQRCIATSTRRARCNADMPMQGTQRPDGRRGFRSPKVPLPLSPTRAMPPYISTARPPTGVGVGERPSVTLKTWMEKGTGVA